MHNHLSEHFALHFIPNNCAPVKTYLRLHAALPCNKELLLMKDSALVRQGLEAEEERQVGNR